VAGRRPAKRSLDALARGGLCWVVVLGGGAVTSLAAATSANAQIECGQFLGRVRCPSREQLAEADLQRESCKVLWTLRNTFFKARGYCFRMPDGIATFGNEGCQHFAEAEVPFNTFERDNIRLIREVEKAKGC
jgi:hypothetical protein